MKNMTNNSKGKVPPCPMEPTSMRKMSKGTGGAPTPSDALKIGNEQAFKKAASAVMEAMPDIEKMGGKPTRHG